MHRLPQIAVAALLALAATPAPAETNEAHHPAPRIRTDPPWAEFGSVLDSRLQHQAVVVSNDGDAPLVIHDVHLSCPICLSYELDLTTIAPGENALLTLQFDPRGYVGETEHLVVLMTNDPHTPNLGIPLRADVISNFRVEGGPVYFEALGEDEVRTRRVKLVPHEPLAEPLEIRSVTPPAFHASLEPDAGSDAYWLDVTTVPTNGVAGMMVGLIEFGVPSRPEPVYSFNVVSELMTDFRLFPRLRFDPRAEEQLRTLFIRQTGLSPLLEITSVQLPSDHLEYEIFHDSGLSRMRINVYSYALGERKGFLGDILVQTNDERRNPIRVPVVVERAKNRPNDLARPICFQ